MTIVNRVLDANAAYAGVHDSAVPARPVEKVAVVACMDARMDVGLMLGLTPGQSHIIRNAGGVVTEDVIRSLAISQRKLGTRHVLVVQHTDCAMATFTDEEFNNELRDSCGQRPNWSAQTFTDLNADVRQSMTRLTTSPFLAFRDSIRGFVMNLDTGKLREVL